MTELFQAATTRLMQPFDLLDRTVQEKKPVDAVEFFRLFLGQAERFSNDCSTEFAAVLRQSTRLDAVRGTTVKQLVKEIHAEAFEGCDAALAKYHQTVSYLMGGAEAVVEQADNLGAPLSPTGGALLGSLVAGKGNRATGAAVGGLTALAGAMSTLNRQIALHGQALELVEQAEKAAPMQVADYFEAVNRTPETLVDLMGAKCFGGAVDMQAQQQCVQSCLEHTKGLNARATESVQAMYRHLERLAAKAEVQAAREEKTRQQELEAKLKTRRYIRLAVSFGIAVIIGAVQTLDSSGGFGVGGFIGFTLCMTAAIYVVSAMLLW